MWDDGYIKFFKEDCILTDLLTDRLIDSLNGLCSMAILLQVSVTSFQNVVVSFHYEVTLFH